MGPGGVSPVWVRISGTGHVRRVRPRWPVELGWAFGALTVAALVLLSSLSPSAGRDATAPTAAGGGLVTDGSSWPTYLGSLAHRGVQWNSNVLSSADAANVTLVWNASTGGVIVEQPIVVNSSVYVGSWDGNEYAFNVTSGAVLWKTFVGTTAGCGFASPRGPSSVATYARGTLYFTGGGEDFVALDAVNGSLEWQTFLMNNSPTVGFYGWASGMVYNGYAYVGLASGCSRPNIVGGLDKVSIASHQVVAHLVTTPPGSLGADIWGTPTYDTATNSIFVSTGNDTEIQPYQDAQLQLNPRNLSIESNWTVPARLRVSDGDFGTTPVMVTTKSGQLLDLATDKDGILFALNRTNLSTGPLWATRISAGPSFSTVAFAQGELYVGTSPTTIKGTPVNGSVRAINPSNGRILWSYPMPGTVYGAISYDNGLVAAAGGNEVVLLNAWTGTAVWTYSANTQFKSPVSFAHGMLFVGAVNGELYAFGLFAPGSSPPPGGPTGGSGSFAAELRAIRFGRRG